MKEEWRLVVGYDGRYRVSNTVRVQTCVKRISRGKGNGRGITSTKIDSWTDMKVSLSDQGYHTVSLSLPGKRKRPYKVAILYLSAFVRPPLPKEMARHLNDIRSDDSPSNLAWGSHKQNSEDAKRNGKTPSRYGEDSPVAILTSELVREIREKLSIGTKQKVLAKEYGVARTTISAINNRYIWAKE